MIQKQYLFWEPEEYHYQVCGKFVPSVTAYLHTGEENGEKDTKDSGVRPAIVVTPGGGYTMVSSTEGEIVAKRFYEKGYQTFVLTYTTNLLMDHPLKFQALKDLSRAVVLIRKYAAKLQVNAAQIAVCGFSAGGHLCGSLLVHHDAEELKETGDYAGIPNRPDAGILCYPVITSGEYAHKDSFRVLLGEDASAEEYEYMSLEKHVTQNTPPTFLWHTITDELVPVENSILFAEACRKANVPVELHLFGNGGHGMSLANEEWRTSSVSGSYCLEQFFEILQYRVDCGEKLPAPFDQMGTLPPGTDVRTLYLREVPKLLALNKTDDGIAAWPEMVDQWLKKNL